MIDDEKEGVSSPDPENGDDDELETETEEQPVEGPEEGPAEEPHEDRGEGPQQLTPAQRRIRQEIERRRALESELQAVKQNQAWLQEQMRSRASYVDPVERQRRLDQMDPEQRYQYLREEDRHEYNSRLNRIEYAQLAQNDAFQFQAYLSGHPEFRKYEIDVESLFNQAMQKGQPQSRNAILSWVIGEQVRNKTPAAVQRARKTAQGNIERATTRPATARSNVASTEKRPMTAEERLVSNLERGAYGNQF